MREVGFDPATADVDIDGWGGGLRIGRPDDVELDLRFRVPDAVADQYRRVDTPWGRRTGKSGMLEWSERVRSARMAPRIDDGIDFTITAPQVLTDPAQPVRILLRAENVGRGHVAGREAFVFVLCGTFEAPWRRRNMYEVDLPVVWRSLEPGDICEYELEFTPPNVKGYFSVLVVLHVSDPPREGAEGAVVYSNAAMFQTTYPNCPPRC